MIERLDTPKITIVIPTRERCRVLEYSLRTATAQEYDNLEIIVSDNCSSDDTQGVVSRVNDHRIRYLNTGKRLSMSHNWEFALSHVEAGWVTIMGDDDGLMPTAIRRAADLIRTTGCSAIRSRFCTYDWPGVGGRKHGQLIVPLGSRVETRNSASWLLKVLRGEAKYRQLPMIYNGGFINIHTLRQIKERLGSFFTSSIPDVFSAVAIAKLVPDYVFVHEPLAISGTSRYSNGNSAFSVDRQRDRQPYTQFLSEDNIPFHSDMPLSVDGRLPLSLQACAYEAHLQSARLGMDTKLVNHQQQLVAILATAGKHRASIRQWGERFAQMHGIDYQAARRSAEVKRFHLQSTAFAQKVAAALNSVIIDSLPINNVHEASIAAAVIRSSPGRADSLRFMAGQFRELFKRDSMRSKV